MIQKVFKPVDRNWRGIGSIPKSGYGLRGNYKYFDAADRFDTGDIKTEESDICIAGQVLQGLKKPSDCPAFGTLCTPQNPLGAPMVSSEGACAAYYRYGKK
jgi:hydrogenase expression/formation protein HypD